MYSVCPLSRSTPRSCHRSLYSIVVNLSPEFHRISNLIEVIDSAKRWRFVDHVILAIGLVKIPQPGMYKVKVNWCIRMLWKDVDLLRWLHYFP